MADFQQVLIVRLITGVEVGREAGYWDDPGVIDTMRNLPGVQTEVTYRIHDSGDLLVRRRPGRSVTFASGTWLSAWYEVSSVRP